MNNANCQLAHLYVRFFMINARQCHQILKKKNAIQIHCLKIAQTLAIHMHDHLRYGFSYRVLLFLKYAFGTIASVSNEVRVCLTFFFHTMHFLRLRHMRRERDVKESALSSSFLKYCSSFSHFFFFFFRPYLIVCISIANKRFLVKSYQPCRCQFLYCNKAVIIGRR